ncbi:MAG: hypothetical protein VYB40_03305 [Candidatus Thermoplasmatota archaeon]|nr:hypothetical protein [Candidatus Thermoplasmatota archaeon]
MEYTDTPSPPSMLLSNDEHCIVVDTEGGIVRLHPQRLNSIDPTRHPFPGKITEATIVGANLLVATWVERELSLARIAAIDLRDPLVDGPELLDLRSAAENGRLNSFQVSGSIWSHVLDAEPLAICSMDGDIVFATHHRGVYRVAPDATELWRLKLLEWESLSNLPDGDVIVQLIASNGSLWAFSLGGGWAEIDSSDGSIIRMGVNKFKSTVLDVWNGESQWLFSLSENRMARWLPGEGLLDVVNVGGPIQAAIWDSGRWLITGWREDITWGGRNGTNPDFSSRSNIGIHIQITEEGNFLVLDNMGKWSNFSINLLT